MGRLKALILAGLLVTAPAFAADVHLNPTNAPEPTEDSLEIAVYDGTATDISFTVDNLNLQYDISETEFTLVDNMRISTGKYFGLGDALGRFIFTTGAGSAIWTEDDQSELGIGCSGGNCVGILSMENDAQEFRINLTAGDNWQFYDQTGTQSRFLIEGGGTPGAQVLTLSNDDFLGVLNVSPDVALDVTGDAEVSGTAAVTGLISTAVGLDAIGAVDMDYGSADVTDHTFVTDNTGTAEVVLPAGSIDSTEILDDTIDAADLNASAFTDIDTDYGAETVTAAWDFVPAGTGDFADFDLDIGGASYGALRLGEAGIYKATFSNSNLDLGLAMVFRQEGNLEAGNDPGIEFAFMEGGNTIRLAIPESGAGNATAFIRSGTFAGPYSAAVGNNVVDCDQWSSYDSNIDCDTSGTGADLFVQDDFEVEGDIYTHESIFGDADDADQHEIAFADASADRLFTFPDDQVASADLIIGSGAGTVGYANMSGDATMSTGGAVTIAADAIEESMLKAVDAAADEECFTFEATTGDFEWQACGTAGTDSITPTELDDDANSPTAGYAVIVEAGAASFDYLDISGHLAAETNDLEADDPPNVEDTEIYIGTGSGTGNWAAMSVDATMSNAGVVTVVDDSHAHVVGNVDSLDADLATFALPASTTISAFGKTVVDDADAATHMATVGLTATAAEINTPLDGATVTLTEFEELAAVDATTISGGQWAGLGGVTAAGLALWDDANAAAQLVTLGVNATESEIDTPLDGALVTLTEFRELEAIDATTISTTQWGALGGATAAGLALWDDADADAQLVSLGLTATATEINTPLDGATVTLTEFEELATVGSTVIAAADWTQVALLDGGAPALTGTNFTGIPSSGILTIVESMSWPAGAFSSDGTQCADPAAATINSGPKMQTVICTDNDASVMQGHTTMPDGWDAGNLTFELAYIQTAANTAALEWDIYVQCRGAAETVNNTWETAVNVIDAGVTGSNGIDHTTSGNVTCASDAAGDELYWKIEIDASGTGTAMATVHFTGVKMEYTSNVGD